MTISDEQLEKFLTVSDDWYNSLKKEYDKIIARRLLEYLDAWVERWKQNDNK